MLNQLKEIGLTKGEINVYEALLELGESTKTPIVQKSGISQGKVYDVLDRLMRKGLVAVVKKRNITHFKVANPKQVMEYVLDKKKRISKEEAIVKEILPTLISKYNSKIDEPNVELYKGWKGLDSAYNILLDTLGKGDTDYILGGNQGNDPEKTENFFSRFNNKRIEKGIRIKMIYDKKDKQHLLSYVPKSKRINELRFIDLQTPAEINICKNIVAIVILTLVPVVIIIRSSEASKSFLEYFNALWKMAKK